MKGREEKCESDKVGVVFVFVVNKLGFPLPRMKSFPPHRIYGESRSLTRQAGRLRRASLLVRLCATFTKMKRESATKSQAIK